MVPTPSATTYRALCNDPDKNPLGKDLHHVDALKEIYTNWSLAGDNPADSEELSEAVLMDMDEGMVGGLLAFLKSPDPATNPGGVAVVLHNFKKHTSRSSPHRGTVFAYMGDVLGQDIELLSPAAHATLYAEAAGVYVSSSVEKHLERLNASADGLVTKLADTDEEVKEVDTRSCMFLPYPLLPYVLGRPPLNAKEAFETLIPVIRSLRLEEACAPLIDFLMVATTRAGQADPSPVLREMAQLGAPVNNVLEVAQARRKTILYRQLPGIMPHMGTSDPALEGILGAMKDVRDGLINDLADRKADREDKKLSLTPEQRWKPQTLDRLQKMCGVMNADNLPQLYNDLAAHKKADGTTRQLIQEQVEAAAHTLRIQHVPTVTVQQATALAGWVFFGAGEQSLGEGLLPFSVIPPNQVSAGAQSALQEVYAQNMDYNTVMTGSTSITSSDASKMRTSKGYLPANFEEMIVQLQAYTCLLAALLGIGHPNVSEHRLAVELLVRNSAMLKQFVVQELGPQLGAATIVYYFQIRHRNWFQQQWMLSNTVTLPPPSLREGFDTFANTYTITWLPKTSHVDVLRKLARPVVPAVTPSGSPARTAGTGGSGSSNSGDASVPTRTRVSNRNRDSALIGETPLARRLREKTIAELIAFAGGAPKDSAGRDRCLSWQLKGKCFSDCSRAYDHITLGLEERDELREWCQRAAPAQ